MLFYDFENYEIITEEQLYAEYMELKTEGNTETETFADYVENCMDYNNGALERYRYINHLMENKVEEVLRRDYILENSEVIEAVEDIVYRCFSVTGKPKIDDLEDYIAEYMDR